MNVFLLYVFRQENKLDLIAIAFITLLKNYIVFFVIQKYRLQRYDKYFK